MFITITLSRNIPILVASSLTRGNNNNLLKAYIYVALYLFTKIPVSFLKILMRTTKAENEVQT